MMMIIFIIIIIVMVVVMVVVVTMSILTPTSSCASILPPFIHTFNQHLSLIIYFAFCSVVWPYMIGTNDIGFLLSLAGITFAIFTSMVLPWVSTFRKSTLYWIGCIFTIPAALAFPCLPIISTAIQRHVDNSHHKNDIGTGESEDGWEAYAVHQASYWISSIMAPSDTVNDGTAAIHILDNATGSDTQNEPTAITNTHLTWGMILFFLLWKNVTLSLAFVAVAVQVNQSVDRDIGESTPLLFLCSMMIRRRRIMMMMMMINILTPYIVSNPDPNPNPPNCLLI
jgi:hypothetical protein